MIWSLKPKLSINSLCKICENEVGLFWVLKYCNFYLQKFNLGISLNHELGEDFDENVLFPNFPRVRKMIGLFKNKGFILDELALQNASEFVIFLE